MLTCFFYVWPFSRIIESTRQLQVCKSLFKIMRMKRYDLVRYSIHTVLLTGITPGKRVVASYPGLIKLQDMKIESFVHQK
uniref:Uncharacterized protein n=1 Tax=Anguilla anguilla TaxID=7936 RepID=A0A0E9WXW8_ANGAN